MRNGSSSAHTQSKTATQESKQSKQSKQATQATTNKCSLTLMSSIAMLLKQYLIVFVYNNLPNNGIMPRLWSSA